MRSRFISKALLTTLFACHASTPLPSNTTAMATLQACESKAAPTHTTSPWKHKRSALVAAMGAADHVLEDVITTSNKPISLVGKFAYGSFSKDLEDETIEVYLSHCGGWQNILSTKTTGDGRINQELALSLAEGRFALRAEVAGDRSAAEAQISVLPPNTKLVVFDIDGTLTQSDSELITDIVDGLFRPMHDGQYKPILYPFAVELLKQQSMSGLHIVYLSGRPYWLTGMTRAWLKEVGAPEGTLHLARSNREAVTNNDGVGAYKLAYLKQLQAQGFVIERAFGNASTDVFAYTQAGIDPSKIWIIGKHGGEQKTNAVKDSWENVVKSLSP